MKNNSLLFKPSTRFLELGNPDFEEKKARTVGGCLYRVIDLEQIEYMKVTKVSCPNRDRYEVKYVISFKSGAQLKGANSAEYKNKKSIADGEKILKAWRKYRGLDSKARPV